jgi:hypothetical protein
MEMFIHFQVLCDDVAGRKDHILWTPKRLQAAVSNRSAGERPRPSRFSSHLLAVSGAIVDPIVSLRPKVRNAPKARALRPLQSARLQSRNPVHPH